MPSSSHSSVNPLFFLVCSIQPFRIIRSGNRLGYLTNPWPVEKIMSGFRESKPLEETNHIPDFRKYLISCFEEIYLRSKRPCAMIFATRFQVTFAVFPKRNMVDCVSSDRQMTTQLALRFT